MKRHFLLLTLFMTTAFCSLTAQTSHATDTISVFYETPQDNFVQGLMEFQGIYGFNVQVKTDLKVSYLLYMVQCTNGTSTRKALNKVRPLDINGQTNFQFFAKAQSPDTAHIAIQSPIGMSLYLPVPTEGCILMETLPTHTYTAKDRIPLIAYTTGHKRTITWSGQEGTLIDYCGVRFSKSHPSEWYKKFHIKDYIYFELEPCSDQGDEAESHNDEQ